MTQGTAERAREEPRQEGGTPLLEWISAALGLLLTLAMLGMIGWEAWRGAGGEPPAVAVRVERIVPVTGGWIVEVLAVNSSPATAAAVEIEGELRDGEHVIATSQTTLDYVPGESERRAGLFFAEDPQAYSFEVRALGYVEP